MDELLGPLGFTDHACDDCGDQVTEDAAVLDTFSGDLFLFCDRQCRDSFSGFLGDLDARPSTPTCPHLGRTVRRVLRRRPTSA